eukprot:gene5712-995_t
MGRVCHPHYYVVGGLSRRNAQTRRAPAPLKGRSSQHPRCPATRMSYSPYGGGQGSGGGAK